jgi:hypothetical protein
MPAVGSHDGTTAETTLSLFSRCPACRRNLTDDPREPCGECLEAFGPMLRRTDRQTSAEEFARQVAEGDKAVAAAYAAQRALVAGERRPMVRRAGPDGKPEPLLWGWLPVSEQPPWSADPDILRRPVRPGQLEELARLAGLEEVPAGWRDGECYRCGDRYWAVCPNPDEPGLLICMRCYGSRPGADAIRAQYISSGECRADLARWAASRTASRPAKTASRRKAGED